MDASIDAVGFEAKGSKLETVMTNLKLEGSSGKALRQAMAATRRGGSVSVPGVYAGFIHGFLFGDAFDKGLAFRMGQTHVQHYTRPLLERIQKGDIDPSFVVTHRVGIDDVPSAYQTFRDKEEGCIKVVVDPWA